MSVTNTTLIRVRHYGEVGPTVVLLHGGPGAPGHMAPVGRFLSDGFHILEPFQRESGAVPLTVDLHLQDLDAVIRRHAPGRKPALVGASWGAMLALAYAASHPETVGPIVLIGCGTFDAVARAEMSRTLDERMGQVQREALSRAEAMADPSAALALKASVMSALYDVDPVEEDETEYVDGPGHEQSWADMIRLQERGVYPAAFSRIASPVMMFHGDFDPHPGRMIFQTLRAHIPRLEFREFERCGHSPWRERHARDAFHAALRDWLGRHLGG